MKSHRGSSAIVAATFVLLCSGADAEPRAAESQHLTITDCRLVAFERALLAGERAGIVESVAVREGDRVQQGDIVARLRDDVPRAAYETARVEASNDVEFRFAQKAAELAQLEYDKALRLNSEIPGAKSESDVLKLKLDAERLALQVEQARFKLNIADIRREEAGLFLKGFSIEAPLSGTVLQVHHRRGEALDAGGTVMEIANFERLRVEGLVPLADSFAIRPDQPVAIRIVFPDAELPVEETTYSGRVTFVDSAVQEISQQVRVWAEIENTDGLLKEGLPTVMQISIAKGPAQTANRIGRTQATSRK